VRDFHASFGAACPALGPADTSEVGCHQLSFLLIIFLGT
jgi:hypothetical protein